MPLIDEFVAFTCTDGDVVVASVTHVWLREGLDTSTPLVNLKEKVNGKCHTSVPHKSEVVGALGYFYS